MNNDLISREALKEAFEDCTGDCACCIHNTNDFKYCGLIDNAQAVEPDCLTCKQYEDGYVYGFNIGYNKAKSEFKRPQGKWKEYKLRNDIVVEYAFKCSNCKEDSGLFYPTDFCPNCGADMRGDTQ